MKNLDDPKYREYSERYGFWQDVSLKQLSFSNNLFLVVAFTFIGFIYKQIPQSEIYCTEFKNADCSLTLIIFSIIVSSISILSGFFCILTRLTDFRITRNIILTRKRFYKLYSDSQISEGVFENGFLTEKTNKKNKMCFIGILFCPQQIFIQSEDISVKQLKRKTNQKLKILNYWSDNMGKWSWRFHYWQIISLFFAFIFFVLSII